MNRCRHTHPYIYVFVKGSYFFEVEKVHTTEAATWQHERHIDRQADISDTDAL